MFSPRAQQNPSVSCSAARFPELKSLTSIVNSPLGIFSFLNYSDKINNQEVKMWYRRHKLKSTVILLPMCTTEYGFIEISSLFEQVKVKN